MIPQGFPLWALNGDGMVFSVIGWYEGGAHSEALLIAVGEPGALPVNASAVSTPLTFTTTDPSESDPGVDYRADSDRLASLIGRLVRLADDLERSYPNYGAASHAVQRIRQELNR